ncbi:MAG TPA: type II secretion system minor pseudopilin GspI [Steroidobacteraceae bacterium]
MRPRSRARGRTDGFTLVEVLVALAIVVVGITALLSALTSAADTTAYLRDKTQAEWIGLNQLAATRLALARPTPGKTRASVDYAGRKWVWSQQIVPLSFPGALRIDVQVALAPPGAANLADTSAELPWIITVSAIVGDAVALPNGIPVDWTGANQYYSTSDPLRKPTGAGAGTPGATPGPLTPGAR